MPGISMRPLLALTILLFVGVASLPEARADLRVNERKDTVELDDGKLVECVVIMETKKGVLIILPGAEGRPPQQIFIPADKVKKVTRGADEGRITGYQTETNQAQKVVQGTGFRDPKALAKAGPIDPTGPIGPITPIAPIPGAPVQGGPAKPMKLSSNDLIREYYSRYPGLSNAAGMVFGDPNRAAGWLEKALTAGPDVRARVEDALNRLNQEPTEAVKTPAGGSVPGRATGTPANPAAGARGKKTP